MIFCLEKQPREVSSFGEAKGRISELPGQRRGFTAMSGMGITCCDGCGRGYESGDPFAHFYCALVGEDSVRLNYLQPRLYSTHSTLKVPTASEQGFRAPATPRLANWLRKTCFATSRVTYPEVSLRSATAELWAQGKRASLVRRHLEPWLYVEGWEDTLCFCRLRVPSTA